VEDYGYFFGMGLEARAAVGGLAVVVFIFELYYLKCSNSSV
jgi:hypothetical protein